MKNNNLNAVVVIGLILLVGFVSLFNLSYSITSLDSSQLVPYNGSTENVYLGSYNITATNLCYSDGTNCQNVSPTNITGNLTVINLNVTGNSITINRSVGKTETYQIVCDVDLVGLTKKYQNFTYTGGILTSNTTCT